MFKKTLMAAVLALALPATAPMTATAGQHDLDTAEGMAKVMRKIQCSLKDGEAVTYWWHGKAFGRRMGMSDKYLFDVEGMNVRHCGTARDKNGNYGYTLRTREILLYKDKSTGEVLKAWENPYTGETVEVWNVDNDPVNSGPSFGMGRDGKPQKFPGDVIGDRWWFTSAIPLFYTNVLSGEYQKYIGGQYRATEMFNFFGDKESLMDDTVDSANVQVGWVRHSDWLPWMEMAGRDGIIYMHTAGRKLDDWNDMSDTMKDQIAKNYPKYTDPPPLDDDRENVTSWTFFKKKMEERGGPEPLKREFPF